MSTRPRLAVQQALSAVLRDALERAAKAGEISLDPAALPEPVLERPRMAEHGDWASNVALTLSKAAKAPPRKIAEAMVAHLDLPDWVAGVEIAGPGFVNVRLAHAWFEQLIARIVEQGPAYGTVAPGTGQKVQVEFISANPTGPLHVGNARWAAVGDSIANLLTATGDTVEREYYVNDAGNQLDLLGASVEAAYLAKLGRPAEPPENGYLGAFIDDIADALIAEQGEAPADLPPAERRTLITEWSYQHNLAGIRRTMERFGVEFDVWFSERTLHESGAIQAAVEALRARQVVADRDGAVFLETSRFGDDKDRPLIRSDGRPTYFGADAAYWRDVRARGFDHKIYLLGADHHGYVGRMKAIVRAGGDDGDTAEFIIGQMVNLYRNGEPVRMSKRSGELITFDELVEEVGRDAARYTMLRAGVDAPMDFDLDAVKRQSSENPVFYVQYAHARIASVVREAESRGLTPVPVTEAALDRLDHPMELALLRMLAAYEELVPVAAELRAPHRLTRYAEDLAAAFHRFYGECRVLTDDAELSSARWWLCTATRQVLANTLGLIGVSAPDRM
jgi:arginyl-tRNA synthetase